MDTQENKQSSATLTLSTTFKRYPFSRDPSLKAWDSADAQLIQRTVDSIKPKQRVLVVNDEFGAIAATLAASYYITHWSDSLLSQIATQKNAMTLNAPSVSNISFLPSTAPLPNDNFAQIIIRPSKNLRLLDYQLATLAHHYPGTLVVCGMMQKHITSGLRKILERWLVTPEASLAVKKSRIVGGRLKEVSSAPIDFQYFSHDGLQVANRPNVFSSDSLDIGARFLLEHFPSTAFTNICDLGCGNGILSAAASRHNPNAKIIGLDESFMAVSSANETFRQNQLSNGQFIASNIFSELMEETFDLILCNPPFHQQRLVTTDTAKLMMKQSRNKLNAQGELWIIANRHLGYHKIMKHNFSQVEQIAANQKFVILRGING